MRNWEEDEAAGSWLLALFPAIYQAPFPALFSLHSFVSATALKRIYSLTASLSARDACRWIPVGIWHPYCQTGLCQPFPVPSQGTAQPFAETQLQLRFLLLNKPPPGSSTDVRLWKYLCEGLELARRGRRHRNWEEGCSLPILRRCAHLWPAPAALSGHGG